MGVQDDNQGNRCHFMVLDSPLPLPKFRLGADSAADCAKRDGQRSESGKAAQTRRCPMPDAFLVGYTEG